MHNWVGSMSPLHGYRVRSESGPPDAVAAPTGNSAWEYGTCLYLGPRGQRCDRPAREDGFCALHTADALSPSPWVWFRRLAAILVAAAILWPIVEALLDELSLWKR
jgi:Family of unknown function (DUF5763)